MRCDTILTDARLLTMVDSGAQPIANGLVAIHEGRIIYAGAAEAAPALEAAQTIPCGGRLVTPALIDAHTHLVHGGHRADEFEMRLEGASYEAIARAGGGIVSTMRATRQASVEDLAIGALPRLDALLAEGVGTIEVKSGYGLTVESELAMLRAARRLGELRPVRVVTTFLGAHALPPEYAGRADAYIDLVCHAMLPAVAGEGLADGVDAFCEGIAFSPEQVSRVFATAQALGLPVRIHAEQLSNLGGAAMAARHGALSADHLEYLDEAGIAAMAAAGTVATLLPGAYYFCRETQIPPVAALRAAGVPIAIATDCNPGTSPLTSLLLAMNMAATLFRLTIAECWAGVTVNAARALGLAGETGALAPGLSADIAIWDAQSPAELVYRMGARPLHTRIWKGRRC
ncbi:MAG: imidazolonepropionase [Novosphingobium sp.]